MVGFLFPKWDLCLVQLDYLQINDVKAALTRLHPVLLLCYCKAISVWSNVRVFVCGSVSHSLFLSWNHVR